MFQNDAVIYYDLWIDVFSMQTSDCQNKKSKTYCDENIYAQLAGKTSSVLNVENIKISEQ